MKHEYQAESATEARVAYILMKAGVTGPEIDECIAWAFGPGAWYIPIFPDWIERWKKLHPQFSVKRTDSFVEWMYTVGFLFVQWKHYQAKKGVKGNGK